MRPRTRTRTPGPASRGSTPWTPCIRPSHTRTRRRRSGSRPRRPSGLLLCTRTRPKWAPPSSLASSTRTTPSRRPSTRTSTPPDGTVAYKQGSRSVPSRTFPHVYKDCCLLKRRGDGVGETRTWFGRARATAWKGWLGHASVGQDFKQSKLKGPNEPTWTPCRPWRRHHHRPRSSPRPCPVPARWVLRKHPTSWPRGP
jgi:hypothetical protein